MVAKIWRLTLLIGDPEFKRRFKTVAAAKDMSYQEFGISAIEAAIEAAEKELERQEQVAA